MNRYINCIAHKSSEGNLLIGNDRTALVDCGMAFCAGGTIQRVKDALKQRPLDYIILTHTHYDHIGALPFFINEWPELRTVTSATGAEVLLKATPRRVIRELSLAAAEKYGAMTDTTFSGDVLLNTDVLHSDIIVKEGESVSLGGLTVEVFEAPGHTRDSINFFIPELEMLIGNETPGVLMPDGSVYPGYLSSYTDTINSIEKCRKIPFKQLSLPHRGLVSSEDGKGYFDKALSANIACRDFILGMKKKGLNEDEMQDSYYQHYCNETLLSFHPIEAFLVNTSARISTTLREYEASLNTGL